MPGASWIADAKEQTGYSQCNSTCCGGKTEMKAGKPVPVYLFVTSPPQLRDVDANRRTCDMRYVFSAVWCDPRLKQEKNVIKKRYVKIKLT